MINQKLVGEFYHQTTKLTCLIFFLLLNGCAKYEPNPYTLIVRTIINYQ